MRTAVAGSVPPDRMREFLKDPKSYAGHPRSVRLFETHASWVALTSRFAYKVKKPVNFGFLDFSTLEKRRHFCEREVMLNRRLCPDVHLGVVPISLRRGRLVFGAGEEVVEYAVQMRRLPERHFMLHRIARGEAGPRDVDAIVATLKRFYQVQVPTPEIAEWGRVAKLRISTDENFRQTEKFVGVTISRPAFETIRHFTNAFYRQNARLFESRVSEGRIRDCHGDLHLEHIHLGPKRLAIYDCIEFNDRFRYVDVASDVAFLAMDLDFHGLPALADRFAKKMARALADVHLPGLLDFYKCYRAYVRGKVESFHQHAAGPSDVERRASRERAEAYFRLALRYAVSGSEPMVLVVMGRVGSGKSTLARALGRELGWPVFSSDRLRKKLAGVPLNVRGSEVARRRLYAKTMTARTYAVLTRSVVAQVHAQCGAILDATYGSRLHRSQLCKTLKRLSVNFCFVEVKASDAAIKRRLGQRAHVSGEISDARLEDFPKLARGYEPPDELDPRHCFAVRTAGAPEVAVTAALKGFALRRI